jgi:hypothetical protein
MLGGSGALQQLERAAAPAGVGIRGILGNAGGKPELCLQSPTQRALLAAAACMLHTAESTAHGPSVAPHDQRQFPAMNAPFAPP